MRMPTHHPGDALLLDYVSGALPEPAALAVATHLALCPACRRAATALESVGGALFESLEPEAVEPGSLEALMARLDEPEPPPARPPRSTPPPGDPLLPEPLRGYVGGDLSRLRWQRLLPGLSCADVAVGAPSGGPRITTRLMRLTGNVAMPRHTHEGLELTLVLDGGFRDVQGEYLRGDLAIGDPTLDHSPTSDPEGCLCLAVTIGPLRLTGLLGRFLNPFVRF